MPSALGGAAPIRIQLLESLDALAPLADAWHALLEEAIPGRGFFYRVPMLQAMAPVHAAANHPGGRRSPFFLLAWRGEKLVGGLPLVLERKPLTRVALRRLLFWAGDGSAVGAEVDVPLRGDEAERTEIVAALRQALTDGVAAGRFDVLDIENFREDSAALPLLRRTFGDGSWRTMPLTSHHVELAGGYPAYRASRSGSRIRELGRLRRKLEAAHRIEILETSALTDDDLRAVMRLHGARQALLSSRGERREAVFERHAGALASLLVAAGSIGATRHRLLLADGQLVAFLLGYVEGDTLLAWLTAVHQDFLDFGAGGVLFWEAVQREFALGAVARIEFGFGTTFVKQTMSTHGLRPWQLEWRPPGNRSGDLRLWAYRRLLTLRARIQRVRGAG